MSFLLLNILCNALIVILFKFFAKNKINVLQAIVINYMVASLFGFLSSIDEIYLIRAAHGPWVYIALFTGCMFISIFYLIAQSTSTIGVTATSIAFKMSLIIPVLVAIFTFHEKLSWIQIMGIILALLSIYLSSQKTENIKVTEKKQTFLLPFLVFLGSGILDSIIMLSEHYLLVHVSISLFLSLVFLGAAIIGIIVIVLYQTEFKRKNILFGIVLGLVNYGSVYFIMRALDLHFIDKTLLYSINNIGIILLSMTLAIILFKERLNKLNALGVTIAVIAILILSLAR